MTDFRALRIDESEKGTTARVGKFALSDLMDGDVTVDVSWSSLNYKDGLAITGKAPVVRRFPMIAGIDFAGVVSESTNERWQVGDHVICNGWGMGETHLGGFAEKARVPGDWLVALPSTISARDAMAIGTAGYTAMLCVMALEAHEITPQSGLVLVTGAAGGVGSIAVAILAKLGFQVVASTGRREQDEYLRSLGATSVIDRDELTGEPRALGKMRWAAAVDSVGSTTLANILSMTKYGGAVAACGLAGGMDLPTSVAPFILRGVRLLGIDSVMCPLPLRTAAWQRLGTEIDLSKLTQMVTEVSLEDLSKHAEDIIAGKVRGRIVVSVA